MAKPKISHEPRELDLVLYAGDGFGLRFIITDVNKEPVNLTGTARAYIRTGREVYTEPPDAEFAVDIEDAATGVLILTLTGEQTSALVESLEGKSFIGVWDVEWTATDAEPLTICQGKVECIPDVTH